MPGDIREEAFCSHLVAMAANQLGGLDLVVSNAARQVAQKSILDISTEQWLASICNGGARITCAPRGLQCFSAIRKNGIV